MASTQPELAFEVAEAFYVQPGDAVGSGVALR